MAIDAIAALKIAAPVSNSAASGASGLHGDSQTGFADALQQLVGAVDQSSGEANDAVGRMLEGTGDVHEAMLAVQKADTMFQLTVQIRNKIVQAYQDVMKMPV